MCPAALSQFRHRHFRKDKTNFNMKHFEESNNGNIHSVCFWEEAIDEIKTVAYMMDAIGDSISVGVPSDPALVNQALYRLSVSLNEVAESLEEVSDDLINEDTADLIPIVMKLPGSDPVLIKAEESLKTFQNLVGGTIDTTEINDQISMVFNENGILDRLPENCKVNGHTFHGTILFIGTSSIEEIEQLINN